MNVQVEVNEVWRNHLRAGQLQLRAKSAQTMGNNNSKSTDDKKTKHPLSNIEPITSTNSFPEKPKNKKRFGINLKFRGKNPVTHLSFKPLDEDRSSLIFPDGINLSGNVKDRQDKTNRNKEAISLGAQLLDRNDELKSQTQTAEEKR